MVVGDAGRQRRSGRPACVGVLVLAVMLLAAPRAGADDVVSRDAAPRWWKGNLHTHTLWSDGDDFPEMVAEWYRTHGYHFLALSDHNVLQQGMRWMPEHAIVARGGADAITKYLDRFGPAWVERRGAGDAAEVRLKPLDEFRALVEERGRFLLIPAEEISDKAEGVPVHVNASNLRDPIQPVGGRTVTEAINNNLRAVHEQAEKAGREILAHLAAGRSGVGRAASAGLDAAGRVGEPRAERRCLRHAGALSGAGWRGALIARAETWRGPCGHMP